MPIGEVRTIVFLWHVSHTTYTPWLQNFKRTEAHPLKYGFEYTLVAGEEHNVACLVETVQCLVLSTSYLIFRDHFASSHPPGEPISTCKRKPSPVDKHV